MNDPTYNQVLATPEFKTIRIDVIKSRALYKARVIGERTATGQGYVTISTESAKAAAELAAAAFANDRQLNCRPVFRPVYDEPFNAIFDVVFGIH